MQLCKNLKASYPIKIRSSQSYEKKVYCPYLPTPGANIINYELFAVNYDAQLSRDKIFTIYGIIHRYIYFLCYEITKITYVKEL